MASPHVIQLIVDNVKARMAALESELGAPSTPVFQNVYQAGQWLDPTSLAMPAAIVGLGKDRSDQDSVGLDSGANMDGNVPLTITVLFAAAQVPSGKTEMEAQLILLNEIIAEIHSDRGCDGNAQDLVYMGDGMELTVLGVGETPSYWQFTARFELHYTYRATDPSQQR